MESIGSRSTAERRRDDRVPLPLAGSHGEVDAVVVQGQGGDLGPVAPDEVAPRPVVAPPVAGEQALVPEDTALDAPDARRLQLRGQLLEGRDGAALVESPRQGRGPRRRRGDVADDPPQGIEAAGGFHRGPERAHRAPNASSAAAVVTTFNDDAGLKFFSAFRVAARGRCGRCGPPPPRSPRRARAGRGWRRCAAERGRLLGAAAADGARRQQERGDQHAATRPWPRGDRSRGRGPRRPPAAGRAGTSLTDGGIPAAITGTPGGNRHHAVAPLDFAALGRAQVTAGARVAPVTHAGCVRPGPRRWPLRASGRRSSCRRWSAGRW